MLNKKAVFFPDYADPLSSQDVGTQVDTTWAKTTPIAWSGRPAYRIWYNTTYGEQTDDWWNAREIHHIRPRAYGGQNDYSNLMPIVTANHRAITDWFRNY